VRKIVVKVGVLRGHKRGGREWILVESRRDVLKRVFVERNGIRGGSR
jgi:hypothetical protein